MYTVDNVLSRITGVYNVWSNGYETVRGHAHRYRDNTWEGGRGAG